MPTEIGQLCIDKSIPVQILHHSSIVMADNYPVNFKLIHFLLWRKGSRESTNFDTFKCSNENLPNSSRYFRNHKSVFLQILYDFSVPWKIIPLYVSGQTLYTFTKGTKKSANLGEFWVLGSKFTKFLSFLKQIGFSSNFVSFFSIMKHDSSVLF